MNHLFLAELKREWILLKRYSVEAISGIIGLTIGFYGLFLSAKYVAGSAFQMGDRLDSVIIGYVLWSLMMFIVSDISGGLQREAQTGTLEQLFLSPFGASRIFVTRALASLSMQLLLNLSILLLIMLLTGSRLSFPPILLLPLATVLLGVYGLALGMGASALLLKQVQRLLGIIQFMLLLVLSLPIETWEGPVRLVGMLLPMAPGAALLRDVMARNLPLNGGLFAIALLNGVGYLAIGLIVFRWSERTAKRQGKLAGY